MPKPERVSWMVVAGVTAFAVALVVGLRWLGVGENLTGDVDGLAALQDGQLICWGWWSIGWRAGLIGVIAAGATWRGLLLFERTRSVGEADDASDVP